MSRIKDFSKVIGIILRGGNYSPSNEKSERKWRMIFVEHGFGGHPIPTLLDQDGWRWFRDKAKEQGYELLVTQRGLMR